mgnify:CR=1 FL=1
MKNFGQKTRGQLPDGSRNLWRPPIALAPLAALLALLSCATAPPRLLQRYEFERPQMGVPFRLVMYAPDETAAETAAAAAFARIKEINAIMSDYEDASELTLLSRSAGLGRPVPVSKDLWRVLSRAHALARQSGGAFDVTAGLYVNLWRRARRVHQLPAADRLAEAKRATGFDKMKLDHRRQSVELTAPGVRLDLGGIAKGYAVDEALAVLRRHGIRSALVAGSGDLAVSGPPPGKDGWRIEIAPHEAATNASPRFALLRHRALATSGDLFQHVEIEGKRYSHIVDPRTGLALTDHSLVTVIARDCATADSLATALSVLGPEAGLPLVRRHRGAEAITTRKTSAGQLEQKATGGFHRFLEPEPFAPDKTAKEKGPAQVPGL